MKAPIPRADGPKPWTTVSGQTFTHWDLWFLVAAAAEDDGWDGLVTRLDDRRTVTKARTKVFDGWSAPGNEKPRTPKPMPSGSPSIGPFDDGTSRCHRAR
jgi:hypothetical protein